MTSPVQLPLAAWRQSFQSHNGLGVVVIPTHPRTLQPRRQRLARRLRRATAYLPSLGLELRISNHRTTRTDVVQQPIRRSTLTATQTRPPRYQLLPARFLALVLERVQSRPRPLLAAFVLLTVNLPPGLVDVCAAVVKVQTPSIQRQALRMDLIADAQRPIDVAHLLVRSVQPDTACWTPHPPTGGLVVAARAGHQPMRLRLLVGSDDLELLVLLICSRLAWRQRPSLRAAAATWVLDLLASPSLLGLRHHRHLHTITAEINTAGCRRGTAIGRRPLYRQPAGLRGLGPRWPSASTNGRNVSPLTCTWAVRAR